MSRLPKANMIMTEYVGKKKLETGRNYNVIREIEHSGCGFHIYNTTCHFHEYSHAHWSNIVDRWPCQKWLFAFAILLLSWISFNLLEFWDKCQTRSTEALPSSLKASISPPLRNSDLGRLYSSSDRKCKYLFTKRHMRIHENQVCTVISGPGLILHTRLYRFPVVLLSKPLTTTNSQRVKYKLGLNRCGIPQF